MRKLKQTLTCPRCGQSMQDFETVDAQRLATGPLRSDALICSECCAVCVYGQSGELRLAVYSDAPKFGNADARNIILAAILTFQGRGIGKPTG
jgi:hypothetical protein